ncbi:MAG: RHS repeat domain-containing protein [Mangrovibacterium sp.]
MNNQTHTLYPSSASYITNLDGEVVQHVEYVPFGEVFIEERNNTWNTPFLFNGKEYDSETGLYYYGARYYDARVSLWYGVDPLATYNPVIETEQYIDGQHNGGVFNSFNLNVYGYCYQNPVKLVDPNGKQIYPQYILEPTIEQFKQAALETKKCAINVAQRINTALQVKSGISLTGRTNGVAGVNSTLPKARDGASDFINVDEFFNPAFLRSPLAGGADDIMSAASKAASLTSEVNEVSENQDLTKKTIQTNAVENKGEISVLHHVNNSDDTISIASYDGFFNGEIYYPNDTMEATTVLKPENSIDIEILHRKKYPSRDE